MQRVRLVFVVCIAYCWYACYALFNIRMPEHASNAIPPLPYKYLFSIEDSHKLGYQFCEKPPKGKNHCFEEGAGSFLPSVSKAEINVSNIFIINTKNINNLYVYIKQRAEITPPPSPKVPPVFKKTIQNQKYPSMLMKKLCKLTNFFISILVYF